MQYISFDYLCWVLTAYCMIRLLRSDDPRWLLAGGAAIGLGMLSKYTMAFFVCGVLGGMLLTPARRYLVTKWFWAGLVAAVQIFLPNLLWQFHHHFVSLDFLRFTRTRRNRRTHQIFSSGSVAADPSGRSLMGGRLCVLFFQLTAGVSALSDGCTSSHCFFRYRERPWLLSGSCLSDALCCWRRRLRRLFPTPCQHGQRPCAQRYGRHCSSATSVPWPLHFRSRLSNHAGGMRLPRLTQPYPRKSAGLNSSLSRADSRFPLPLDQRARVGILAGNYGEVGAINLFGPRYGLPPCHQRCEFLVERGYGDPPP